MGQEGTWAKKNRPSSLGEHGRPLRWALKDKPIQKGRIPVALGSEHSKHSELKQAFWEGRASRMVLEKTQYRLSAMGESHGESEATEAPRGHILQDFEVLGENLRWF